MSIELNVKTRETGKTASSRTRQGGDTPAVVYGKGKDNAYFSIELKFAEKCKEHKKNDETITLKSDDKAVDGVKVKIQEITVHPVNRQPRHIDFLYV
ncbi:MAG: hypothetical protein AB8E15_01935 [Bdellovibrionales bacterium]